MTEEVQQELNMGDSVGDSLLDTPESSDAHSEAESQQADWWLSEGVPGVGDKPDYFIDSKYKTLTDQAKGYNEIRQKLGAFTGAPEDGYEVKLSDDLGENFEFDTEGDLYKGIAEFAKENNMSNKSFNDMMNLVAYNISKDEAAAQEYESQRMAKESELLGPDAKETVTRVKQWVTNNVPTDYQDVIKTIGQTAAGVKFLDYMSSKSGNSSIPVSSQSHELDEAKLALDRQSMIGDERFGKDKEFTDMVFAKYKQAFR